MQTVGNVTTIGHGARTEIKLVLGDAEDQKHRNYRRWLAPWLFDDNDGSQAQLLSSLRRCAADGTGAWLVKEFLPDWLKSGTDHLCLHGSVGRGKSTLCALTTQADCFIDDSEGSIVAVPALFAFDRRYTHRPEFLLRTVLAQFCSLQTIPSGIEKEYKRQVEASEIRQILDLACSVIQRLDEDALKLHGSDVTDRTRPLSLILILDALDEVPAREQRSIVEVLDRLSALNSTLKHVRVRIIMFVRTDTSVHIRYQKGHLWKMRHIAKESVDVDIHTAVWMRLRSQPSLQDMSHTEFHKVVYTIVNRVDGMFRLAALYCDEIDKLQRQTTTANEVLELVASLPDEIYNFYDRILERVSDKALRPYLIRALCYLVHAETVQDTDLAAFSTVIYRAWYSWFGKIVERPVKCDDILVPLNGFITKEIYEASYLAQGSVVIKLAHFSVAEYLRLAQTRKTLQGYEFGSDMNRGDGSRVVGLRLYAFRVYGSLFPDYLQTDDVRAAWEYSGHQIESRLNAYLEGTGDWREYQFFEWVGWLWRAHRLLFDMTTNIACVYFSHPKRCWDLQPWAPFSFDVLKIGFPGSMTMAGLWPMPFLYVCLGLWQLSRMLPWVMGKLLAFVILLMVAVPCVLLTMITRDIDRERYGWGACLFIIVALIPGYSIFLFLYMASVIIFLLFFRDTTWDPL